MEILDFVHLKSVVSANPAVLIYFYNTNCAPCQVLRPKVVSMMEHKFPLMKLLMVNASHNSEITAEFGVFSAPTLLVMFDGKEVIRESKFISIDELELKTSRYYSLFFS